MTMTTTSKNAALGNYTEAIDNLPSEAFLGSLLFFSISRADVNLENAREKLNSLGLSTDTMRKNLRPVDAFRKSAKGFAKKFPAHNGVKSELMVRNAGEDGAQAYVHLMLERVVMQQGKKRRIFYEKLAELTFTRGQKKDGEYVNHGVEARRTTSNLPEPLTLAEDQWLTEKLTTFEDRYDHLTHYMDSHAVRTFVREYIYSLSGTCVKESGGLYFVKQDHVEEIDKLGAWVKEVDSEFHSLPLLNLVDQKAMILEAFEEETVQEVDRLVGEVAKILNDPSRQIEEKTFDQYADRAVELRAKVNEYNQMLGARADRAAIEITAYAKQCMALSGRIKQPKTMKAKGVSVSS